MTHKLSSTRESYFEQQRILFKFSLYLNKWHEENCKVRRPLLVVFGLFKTLAVQKISTAIVLRHCVRRFPVKRFSRYPRVLSYVKRFPTVSLVALYVYWKPRYFKKF